MNLSRLTMYLGTTLLMFGCGSSPSDVHPSLAENTLRTQAVTTTYYVNNKSGSNCNNSGAGTSQAQPWCDFAPVNAKTFQPGEQILLARGASWNQELRLTGSGSAGNPIELGAYGSGSRPIITRNKNLGLRAGGTLERGVLLTNPSHWLVHDLEVSYAAVGVEAFYDTKNNDSLTLDNIYVHHIRGITEANLFYAYDAGKQPICKPSQSNTFDGIYQSSGIVITGPYNLPITSAVSDYVLKNLTVSNIEGAHNLTSVSTQFCNILFNNQGNAASNTIQNAKLFNLYLHDDDGGGSSEGCMQSLSLLNTLDSVVFNTWVDRAGGCKAYHGTIGVLLTGNKNLAFTNNLITNTSDSASPDQGGVDYEYQNDGVQTLNNTLEGNAGPGLELLAIRSGNDFSSNHLIEGNVFKNNGSANRGSYKGAINRIGNLFTPTGALRDNLYAEPGGFLTGENASGLSQVNNLAASSPANLYSAASGYSTTSGGASPWSYQRWDGSAWSALTFDASTQRWQGPNGYPFIDRFNLHPEACTSCWVARAFTAPENGTVSIRGRALKTLTNGGDGAVVRVTLNGSPVVNAQNLASLNRNAGCVSNTLQILD